MNWKKLIAILKKFNTNQPCPRKYQIVKNLVVTAQKMIETAERVSDIKKEAEQAITEQKAKAAEQQMFNRGSIMNPMMGGMMGNMMPGMGFSGGQNFSIPAKPRTKKQNDSSESE